jgi:hypothetical protein
MPAALPILPARAAAEVVAREAWVPGLDNPPVHPTTLVG